MEQKKTQAIYEYLLSLILQNKYQPEYKLPSENELAEKFGASRMCAQLAFNKLARKQYVVRKKGSGCYINAEYLLSTQNVNPVTEAKIALLFPVAFSKFLNFIYATINRYFKSRGIVPVFYFSDSVNDEDTVLQLLVRKNYDGIIFYPINSEQPNPTLIELVRKNYPVVLVDRFYNHLDSYTVSSNHFASAYKIVEYFQNHDCKQICFISEPLIYTSIRQRYDGFKTALSHFPMLMKNSRDLIFEHDTMEQFEEVLSNMMKNRECDSIITTSGTFANSVIIAAKRHNLQIGKDIFLALYDEEVSFDNIIDFSYVKIVQDTTAIGTAAADILMKLLNREEVPVKKHSTPTALVEISHTAN